MCSSPRLIAACHVLLRLSMPRHSPCALLSLTSSEQAAHPSLPPCGQSSLAPLLLLSSPNPLALGFGSGTGDASLLRGCSTGSLRIMQASDSVHCSLCYPFKSSTIKTLLPLCCLLAISCLLHCSVFKVQILTFFKVRLKCSLS